MTQSFSFPSELLAPAGCLERLKVALLYGANAVYLAGQSFGLRSASDNFSEIELQEGVRFAHERDAKVYVTLNAFLHDHELKQLPDYIRFLEESAVDAVIVSDPGVLETVHQHSSIPIHLSTQASCLNLYSARAWKQMGASRIVLGREVSIEEAGRIRQQANIPVEQFVHGALCMAYSGNCVISNYTSGRDSNRGGCAQSCRYPYTLSSSSSDYSKPVVPVAQKNSFMSSKDLKGLELIPFFLEHQIDSLKIEGRMKSNFYVAMTVHCYAAALKHCLTSPEESWGAQLQMLSARLDEMPNRGYTTASLSHPATSDSIYQGIRNGSANSSFEVAGTLIEVHQDDFIVVLTQNTLTNHEVLEILTFDGILIPVSTEKMCRLDQESLAIAHPNTLLKLPYPHSPHSSRLKAKNLLRRSAV